MPWKKNLPIYIIFSLFFFLTIFLGYSYSNKTKLQKQSGEALITEPQFKALKTKEEEIEWKDLLSKARADCKPEDRFKSQEERDNYIYNLSVDMLTKLDVERDINLTFKVKQIPRTIVCWAIWMGNDKGDGFGGYRTNSGEIATYSIKLSKEELESE